VDQYRQSSLLLLVVVVQDLMLLVVEELEVLYIIQDLPLVQDHMP
jgi:hypothetical protein